MASGGRLRECDQARHELGKCEGLDEIIVAARLEPLDAIVDPRQVSEKQNRRRHAGPAHHSDNGQAVQFRQHPVENDRIVPLLGGYQQAVGTIGGNVRRVAQGFKTLAQERGVFSIILHDQYFHRHSVGSVLRRFIQNMRAKTSSPSMACSAAMLA